MASPLARVRYVVSQSARVAWYMGHYFASRTIHESSGRADGSRVAPTRPTPGSNRMFGDMAELFQRDLANAERGFYPMPRDHDGGPLSLLRRSRKFMKDVPVAARRQAEKAGREVYSEETKGKLPNYFLQNFHYQTGGYLTQESAELYDMQVEVLFTGSASVMRRQALVPLYECIHGRDQRRLKLLDVACGTGRFLRNVKDAYPRLKVTGLDLFRVLCSGGETVLKAVLVGRHSDRQCRTDPAAGRCPRHRHLHLSLSRTAAQDPPSRGG